MMHVAQVTGSKWQGQLRLGDRWAAWQGATGDGLLHRHFAAQALVSQQAIGVYDAQGCCVHAKCVLIDPLTPHRIAPGGEALIIYVEPGKCMDPAVEELLSQVRSASSPHLLSSRREAGFWATWLAAPPAMMPTPVDSRLAAALSFIEGALPCGAVSLQAVADQASLSSERFRHLLAEQLGVPFKRYVLWRRLRLATFELMAGREVTSAAHAAGFADAAHFARTIKSTFGVTASEALRGGDRSSNQRSAADGVEVESRQGLSPSDD